MSGKRIITDRTAAVLHLAYQTLRSFAAIEREFGYDKKAVRVALLERGLVVELAPRGSKYTDEQVQQWLVDYRRLGSLNKTGELHGVHFMTIYQTLRKRGLIELRPRTVPEDEVNAIAADYRRLKSLAKVADRCGRTRLCVSA